MVTHNTSSAPSIGADYMLRSWTTVLGLLASGRTPRCDLKTPDPGIFCLFAQVRGWREDSLPIHLRFWGMRGKVG